MSRSTRRAPRAQPASTAAPADGQTGQANNADLTANAATSTAARASGAGADIPPPPSDADDKTGEGAKGEFEQPGSTLNPSDPNAPNYRFEPAGGGDNLSADQSIDQGTGVQPPSPVLAAAPAGGGEQTTDPDVTWSDELSPRGRVISVTKGGGIGGTTTREEVLPHGANDQQAAAAKSRLAAWLTR